MATITKTFTENVFGSDKSTWTVNVVSTNLTVTGSTFAVPNPTVTAKYVGSNKGYGAASISFDWTLGATSVGTTLYERGTSSSNVAWASGTLATITRKSSLPTSYATANIFNSSNPTARTVNLTATSSASYSGGQWYWFDIFLTSSKTKSGSDDYVNAYQNTGTISWGTVSTVALDAPPTFISTPTIDKNTPSGYYTGLTTVTVNVPVSYSTSGTTATAKYGGYVSKIALTIGSHTEELTFTSNTKPTSAQTITMNLTEAGSFTPIVTLIDSRNQTATQSLGTINVATYNKPSVSFDVYRTDGTGKKADEGKYAIIDAQVTYTSGPTTIKQKPTVLVNGTDKTSSVTWYSSWTADGGVSGSAISSWSSISSGSKIYGLINGNFSETDSYQITMTAVDTLNGTSDPVNQTLSTAFYTIDFKAGGKEIAFGAPANDDLTDIHGNDFSENGLFKCRMHTWFEQDLNTDGDVNVNAINASGDVTADNITASGDVTVKGHSSPIGTFYTNNVTTAALTANIDAYKNGASLTLDEGVWIVYCYGSMGTNSSAAQMRAIRLYRVSPNGAVLWSWRNIYPNGNWATISATMPMNLTVQTTLRVDASASVAGNGASTWIIAVRIA